MEVKKKGSKNWFKIDRRGGSRNASDRPKVAPPKPPDAENSKSTFYMAEDPSESETPQHRKEKSRSKELKRSSSKFYVELKDGKEKSETPAGIDDRDKSVEVISQCDNTPETASAQNKPTGKTQKTSVSHVRKTRLLFECNANPVIPSQTNTPQGEEEGASSLNSTQLEPNTGAVTNKNLPTEDSFDEDAMPVPPLRKKKSTHKKRIETLDCSSRVELPAGPPGIVQQVHAHVDAKMESGGMLAKKTAVDFLKYELGSAMKRNSLERNTTDSMTKSTQVQDATNSTKTSPTETTPVPSGGVRPKPQILRPKPLLRVTRTKVSSFTTEDFDICHRKSTDDIDEENTRRKDLIESHTTERMSRRDLNCKTNNMDIAMVRRRSRSLGATSVAAIIQRLTMKPVPEKPVVQSKPKRILPTLPTSATISSSLSPTNGSSDKPPKPTTKPDPTVVKGPSTGKPDVLSKPKRFLPNVPKSSSSRESLNSIEQSDKLSSSCKGVDGHTGESPKKTLRQPLEVVVTTQSNPTKTTVLRTIHHQRSRSKSPVDSSTVYGDVSRLSVSLDSGLEKINGETQKSSLKQAHSQDTAEGLNVDKVNTSHDQNHNFQGKGADEKFEPISKSTSYKVKVISERHRVDPVYEDVDDSQVAISDKSTGDKIEDKPGDSIITKTEDSPLPVKMPRKKSLLKRGRDQKSFRKKVYEDVDLKEEIPEGAEEEGLDFSMSDEDSWYSENSFTDDEDLEFEQAQARELGMSPYENVEKTEEGSLEPVTAPVEEAAPIPEYAKDKLYQIANEILTTERAYVDKLHLIDQVFHFQLLLDNRQHRFVPEDHIPHIFLNIKSIYQFHDFLLKQLEERMKNWEDIKKIGDVMMRWAPFLKLYAEYINNFDNAMNVFNTCMKTYPKFAAIVEEIQKKPECGMLTLQHHMLEPIQRVPRYELLLKDYLKHLPEDSPDKEDTQRALDLVTKAAAHANETIRKNERSQKLLSLSERIIGSSTLDLFNPSRELLKEGSITKISARDGSHLVRYLFLFNDYLLVCVPVSFSKLGMKHQYKIKTKLDIEGMRVMEGDDLYTPNTFQVKSKTKSIEFHSSTAEEKDEWQAVLWNTIGEYTKKKMSRMTGPTLTENFQEDELGKRAPTWIKDQAASMCMLCAREFTTFFRRHHCRACGRVICGNCSARKARLLYDNNHYNRICDNCYNILELKLEPESLSSSGMHKKTKGLRGVKASDASLISGYLQMSQNKKTWEKRFFAIRNDFVLYSFKAHQDLFATTSLPLPGYIVGPVKDEQCIGKFIFKLFHVSLKKAYYFQADSDKSYEQWMSVLEKVVRAELPEETAQLTPPASPDTTKSNSLVVDTPTN